MTELARLDALISQLTDIQLGPATLTSGEFNAIDSAKGMLRELAAENAELSRYKMAWHEWRSLQSGDATKMLDAAIRCEAAESRLAEMEGMREEFGNVLREHGLSDLGIARVYDRLADAARAAREQGRG